MGLQAARASDLRAAIDRLPLATRRAMLRGIQRDTIIAGADGNPRGGVCPLYSISSPPSKRVGRPFALAWDRFAGARLPRPASERELRTLHSMLETSIGVAIEPAVPAANLREAIAAHKASQARTRADSAAAASEAQARSEAASPDPETRTPAKQPRMRKATPLRDTGDRDRTEELSQHQGWAWLRPFRRYDDYERALLALEEMVPKVEAHPEAESDRLVPSGAGHG